MTDTPTPAPPAVRPRKQRSDTGAVKLTPRDAACLAWLAQMYGARADVLAHLLGCTTQRAVRVADRWEKAGWVKKARIEAGAPTWIYPTPATVATQMEWDRVGAWVPTLNNARHMHTVARTRAHLQTPHGEMNPHGWTPERALWRGQGAGRRGQRREHIPDGIWHRPPEAQGDTTYVVEVELSAKSLPRLAAIMRDNASRAMQHPGGAVLYVVPTQTLAEHVARGQDELNRSDPSAAALIKWTVMEQIQCAECRREEYAQ